MLKTFMFASMLFFAGNGIAQQAVGGNHSVQQVVIDFFEGIAMRDSTRIKTCSTPDIVLYENGITWNMDSLIRNAVVLNTAADFSRKNEFSFIETVIKRNSAWVSYHLVSDVTRGGKPFRVQWLETVILEKKRGAWKIKVLHSTLIKRS